MESEERSLEDLLAELLAGEEDDAADAAPTDSLTSPVPVKQLPPPAAVVPTAAEFEGVLDVHHHQQQQQSQTQQQEEGHGNDDLSLDLLLSDLLTPEQNQEQTAAGTVNTCSTDTGLQHASAEVDTDVPTAATAAVSSAVPMGDGTDMLMGLVDAPVATSSVPANSTAAAGSNLLIDLLLDTPIARTIATAASNTADTPTTDLSSISAAAVAAEIAGMDDTVGAASLTSFDKDAPIAGSPAAATADAPKPVAIAVAGSAAVTAANVSSEFSDDMLDMLHDMAEVLEEGAAAEALEQNAAATSVTPTAVAALPATLLAVAEPVAPAAAGLAMQQQGGLVPHRSSSLAGHTQQPYQQQQHQTTLESGGLDGMTTTQVAAAATVALPAHERALQQAWQYEEKLYQGGLVQPQQESNAPQQQQGSAPQPFVPLVPSARLPELLSDAQSDWNPAGRPAACGGAMIGGAVLLKLESLAGLFAGAAGDGSSSGGSGGSVDWGEVLAAALTPHGPVQVVAASGPYLAVGTVSGSTLVLQLPQQGLAAQQQGGSAATPLNPSPGHQHRSLPGGAAMWQLGEGLTGDAVTCLGFSVVSGQGDALWLAAGHGSGALTVWELLKRGPRQVAGIGQHGARLTTVSFVPSRSTTLLLSGDLRGRLCLHTFSSLLLRTNVSSKVLANGQYGPILGVSHLTPFAMQGPAASSGGGGLNSPRSVGMSPRPAGLDDAAWKAFGFEDGAWRVGDGVFCLTTPAHVYIARLKPHSQDLLMLFSIPQPASGAQAAVPVAAWLPHMRKGTSAGFRVWSGDRTNTVTNGVSNTVSNGSVVVPVAALALAWGSRLVMFDVPLVGDHVALGDADALMAQAQAVSGVQVASVWLAGLSAGAPETPPSTAGALAAAAAAAGQLRRGGPGSFAGSRAAQRVAQTLEALNPTTAAQLAGHFPLSISGTWSGGVQGSRSGENPKTPNPHEPMLGPPESLPILGVHWLDVDAVAVVCQQGFSSLLLVLGFSSHDQQQNLDTAMAHAQHSVLRVQEQVEWMDQLVDRQWALNGGLATWGMDCGASVVGAGARMYLLGQQGGVCCGRLMPWSERLKTLQDARKFKLGLYYALHFQRTMQQQQQQRRSSFTGSSSEPQAGGSAGGSAGLNPRLRTSIGGLARSEGFGAEPQQLEQWMLSLMLGHATRTLQEAAAAAGARQGPGAANGSKVLGPQQPFSAVSAAAEIAVCTCLLLDRPDVLFSRVYPWFAQPLAADQAQTPAAAAAAAASGCSDGLAAFMHTLEAAVLSNLLEGLDPEVMQALVQYFTSVGQPERVEGCVLHLSITSLDLDQVIRVCEGSGLYSALAYIHTAIGDYRKPLLDLLAAVAGASSRAQAAKYAYKLLVYLRCCFRGVCFPPGAGSCAPLSSLDTVKATLLGTLLFVSSSDLLAEWKQSGGRAAATAAAVTAAAAADLANSSSSSMFCCQLSDPHPALQLLLAVDVAAVVAVLSEATAGWDAVETDLRAAAGKPTAELESVLVATQVVVNAIIALLEAGKFEQWQSSSSSSSGEANGSCVAIKYVIELLAAGRVTVKPSFVLVLLQYLVKQAGAGATAAAAAADSSNNQTSAAEAADAAQLEQQFVSIINVVGVNPSAGPAAAAAGRQQQYDAAALMPSQAAAALRLAAEAGFLRATAAIHHLAGDYVHAIAAHVQLTRQQQVQQQQQHQHSAPAARQDSCVFDYIERFFSSSQAGSKVRQHFMSCVLQQAAQLIQLDPTAMAVLLLCHQPDQQVPVLVGLQQQPLLQFQFLQAAMQQAMLLQQQAQRAAAAEDAAAPAAGGGSGVVQGSGQAADLDHTLVATATAGAEKLLEHAEVADLYVRLLVQFEPESVMPFLQAHHNYHVAAAIQACAAGGVTDAEAFLHERMGDLDVALRLYMATVQDSNSKLVAALLDGRIPVLHVVRSQSDYYIDVQYASMVSADDGQVPWGLRPVLQQLRESHEQVQNATARAAANGSSSSSTESAVAMAAAVAAAMLQLLGKEQWSHGHSGTLQHQHLQHQQQQWLQKSASRSGSTPVISVTHGQVPSLCPHDACCVYAELHKAWMAELSPRLKLKGLGASLLQSSTTVGQALGTLQYGHSAGLASAAAVAAAAGLPGPSGSVSSGRAAAAVLPAIPAELLAVWKALQAALAFCQRNTKTSTGSSSSSSTKRRSSTNSSSKQQDETGGGKQLWFGLMDEYVARVRSLHVAAADSSTAPQQQQQQQQQCSVDEGLLSSIAAAADGRVPVAELPAVLQSAAAAVAAAVAHDLFSLLLDEVVGCMADYLPLLGIVGRVLQQHGSERFGEFRWTLMGLFGATAYESAIMTAANRLITCDAFAAVRRSYLLRQLVREALQEEQQQQQDGGRAAASNREEVGPSTSAAAAAAGTSSAYSIQAPPGGLYSSTIVKTANMLGVLGHSSGGSGMNTVGNSSPHMLSDVQLQLQPAGPAAAHLRGVAAEYRSAAVAARNTKRVYKGEVNLALEIAALNRNSSSSVQGHSGSKGVGGAWHGTESQHVHGASSNGAQAGAADGAAAGRTSFDLDELLMWSQNNV